MKKYGLADVDDSPIAIIGYVFKSLRETGHEDIIEKYFDAALSSDYEHLIKVSLACLEICNNQGDKNEN